MMGQLGEWQKPHVHGKKGSVIPCQRRGDVAGPAFVALPPFPAVLCEVFVINVTGSQTVQAFRHKGTPCGGMFCTMHEPKRTSQLTGRKIGRRRRCKAGTTCAESGRTADTASPSVRQLHSR